MLPTVCGTKGNRVLSELALSPVKDFSLADFQQRAQSIFGRYEFKSLRPGENDKEFKFSGPGVVLICQELKAKNPGEITFKVLMIESAASNALAVAKSLLTQLSRGADGYLFAQLAWIENKEDRDEATLILRGACT